MSNLKDVFRDLNEINSRESRRMSHKNLQKSSLCAEKNMLSRPFWRLAETKISAGLSQVTGPAELIEMAQYINPFRA